MWKIEKLRDKNVENMDKKLSDKNDPITIPALFRTLYHAGEYLLCQVIPRAL